MHENNSRISLNTKQGQQFREMNHVHSLPNINKNKSTAKELIQRQHQLRQKLSIPLLQQYKGQKIQQKVNKKAKGQEKLSFDSRSNIFQRDQRQKKNYSKLNHFSKLENSIQSEDSPLQNQKNHKVLGEYQLNPDTHKWSKMKQNKNIKKNLHQKAALPSSKERKFEKNQPIDRKETQATRSREFDSIRGSLQSLEPKNLYSRKSPLLKHSHPHTLKSTSAKKYGKMTSNSSNNIFYNLDHYFASSKSRFGNEQKTMGTLSLQKAKQDLEQKIKLIDRKLGMPSQQQARNTSSKEKQLLEGKHFKFFSSSTQNEEMKFDAQLDRINSLQDKIRGSIEQYVEYQKMLVDIQAKKGIINYST